MDVDSVSVHKHTKQKNLANIQPSWPHTWSIPYIYSTEMGWILEEKSWNRRIVACVRVVLKKKCWWLRSFGKSTTAKYRSLASCYAAKTCILVSYTRTWLWGSLLWGHLLLTLLKSFSRSSLPELNALSLHQARWDFYCIHFYSFR